MSPRSSGKLPGWICFPRVSGDEPGDPTGKVAETTFSSREWG